MFLPSVIRMIEIHFIQSDICNILRNSKKKKIHVLKREFLYLQYKFQMIILVVR